MKQKEYYFTAFFKAMDYQNLEKDRPLNTKRLKMFGPVWYEHIQRAPTPTCFNLLQLASTCSHLLTASHTCSDMLQPAPTCFNLLKYVPTYSNLLQPAPRALSTIVRINSIMKLLRATLVIRLSFVNQ